MLNQCLGRPLLAIVGAIIDVKGGKLKLQFGFEQAEFSMKHASHFPNIQEQCHAIDVIDKSVINSLNECSQEILKFKFL